MTESRKRISRACDSCNALRTKCDGSQPCHHCLEIGTACEFNRVRKKRGKAARRPSEVFGETYSQYQQGSNGRSQSAGSDHLSGQKITLPALSGPFMSQSPTAQNWVTNLPSPSVRPFDSPSQGGLFNPSESITAAQGVVPPPNGLRPSGQATYTQFPSGPGPHLAQPFSMPGQPARPFSMNGSDLNHLNSLFGPKSESPRSLPGQSPAFGGSQPRYGQGSDSVKSDDIHLKYPILTPYVHSLNFLPSHVLCDLLDTYFDNSPYVFGYVIRRTNVLDRLNPRKTSPGLIYAILCVAAHTCESSFFSNTPVARAKAVQTLFEMSVSALRPLQHDEVGGGALDDVITYLQLGTIIAASEFKGVSLRWLHAAWTLAKELRLNRELTGTEAFSTSETVKEERRRTWWLLYIVDRHLCLCYNKPLNLQDAECSELYNPVSEVRWNSDEDLDVIFEYRDNGTRMSSLADYSSNPLYEGRTKGPSFEVTGPGIFGFFLPLAVILGQICTLTMLKRTCLLSFGDLENAKEQVRQHLHQYSESLAAFDSPSDSFGQVNTLSNPRQFSERAFIPYARQLMHTMYIRTSPAYVTTTPCLD